jgi:regulatory protein
MVITGIERQKKNPRRYNIYVDDEFAIGVDRNIVVDNGLRKGDTITRAQLEALRGADEFLKAYQVALRFLSYRPRSEAEIRTRLKRDDTSEERIDRIIEKLRDEGQLDDRRFADMYAESKMLRKPIGAMRLRRELQQKGIDDTIIRSVELRYCNDEAELENARSLARRKLGIDRSTDPLKRKRRLTDHLLRRGFKFDIIQTVTEEFFDKV